MTKIFFAAVCVAACAAVSGLPAEAAESDPSSVQALESVANGEEIPENATAKEIVEACRAMLPRNVEVKGHINRRSRHGTEVAAYRYRLVRKNGATTLEMSDKSGRPVETPKEGRILDTDVTWSDLSFDYLWWDDVSFDSGRDHESKQGISCRTVALKNGYRTVRAWIDRKTGALVQAEEELGGKAARELFCTSLKKFGDRWAPKNIEVGPKGAKYRTKIVVEDVSVPGEADESAKGTKE